MKFDSYDEHELLALIEDELDPERTRALRQRLAREPAALAAVDRMRSDRRRLRTLEAPAPPADLLADLEPLMARPMLVEMRPSALRRARARRERRLRVMQAALVAAAAVALLVGGWVGVSGLLRSVQERQLADAERGVPSGPSSLDTLLGPDRVADDRPGADGPAPARLADATAPEGAARANTAAVVGPADGPGPGLRGALIGSDAVRAPRQRSKPGRPGPFRAERVAAARCPMPSLPTSTSIPRESRRRSTPLRSSVMRGSRCRFPTARISRKPSAASSRR